MKKEKPQSVLPAADEVAEAVMEYRGRHPGVAAGSVLQSPPLSPDLRRLLDAQNRPAVRQAIRRAFRSSPTELGRAAVTFAAKKS